MSSSSLSGDFSMPRVGRDVVPLVLLLAVWLGLGQLGALPETVFPSPLKIAGTLLVGFANGTMTAALASSVERIILGFGISALVGTTLGLLMGRMAWVDQLLSPVAMGLQALPSICWLPLAALWFGLSEAAILFVVIMGSLLSITLATQAGVKNTPVRYLHAARNLGAQGIGLYWLVILPAALPSILAGLKIGWSFAWRSLMSAELLYVSLGLGQLLNKGRDTKDMSLVVAVMVLIVVLGLVVDRVIFAPIESRVHEIWGPRPA